MPEVVTIYWPSRCAGTNGDGFIVGWAVGDNIFVVACVVPRADLAAACTRIRDIATGAPFSALRLDCGAVPCILGQWCQSGVPAALSDQERAVVDGCFTDVVCTHPWLMLYEGSPAASTAASDMNIFFAMKGARQQQQKDLGGGRCCPLQLPRLAGLLAHPSSGSDCDASPTAPLNSGSDAAFGSSAPRSRASSTSGSGVTTACAAHRSANAAHDLSVSAANVIVYSPPDPLQLNGFSARLRRIPGVHALGDSAVIRVPPVPGPEGLLAAGSGYLLPPVVAPLASPSGGSGDESLSHSPSTSPTGDSGSSSGASGKGSGNSVLPHTLSPGALVQLTFGRLSAQDAILNQLNAAAFVTDIITDTGRACSGTGTGSSGADAEGPRQAGAATRSSGGGGGSGGKSLCGRLAYIAMLPFMALLLAIRTISVTLLFLIQARLPTSIPVLGGSALYERSALARQAHLKLYELSVWPYMLRRLQRLRRNVSLRKVWHSPDHLFAETAAYYDSIFRVSLDLLVGIGACVILAYTPWAVRLVLTAIHTGGEILHIDVLRAWIDWLMGLPAGLKLNHFAGKKIGGAVLSFIDWWEYVTTFLTPYEPAIVMTVGLVGLGGMSLLLAMASDVLSLATIHLYTLYSQFAWLHNQQMSLLSSLWKLFRGKKQNVLRNRVDSNDYDVAQLLLGTLFFTVVFFLFPTTLVYYAFFLVVWMGIVLTRGALWWLITIMNNIPLYSLYCRLFARERLPCGVSLVCIGAEGVKALAVSQACASIMAGSVPGVIDESDALTIDTHATVQQLVVPGPPAPSQQQQQQQASSQQNGATTSIQTDGSAAASSAGDCASASGPPCTLWFSLQSQVAGFPLVCAPLGEAMSVVAQRYSIGMFLRTVIFGEQGMSLFRPIQVSPSAAGRPCASASASASARPSGSGASASMLAIGYQNAGANAPTEGPAATTRREKHAITERILEPSASLDVGTWRGYWGAMREVVDSLTGASD